jgi:phytoene dehydrogenase-like protein
VTADTADVVVIGAGPNGLVAANALADAGWDVVVAEADDEVGGAVRSAEVTAPGFCNDLFSAFYPLAAASPVISDLGLGDFGLRWTHAPAVLSHVLDDGRSAVLSRDPATTAASVDAFHRGDGDAWLEMFAHWRRIRDPLLDALFTPFPPVAAGARIVRALRAAGTLDFARLAVLPVRRLAHENFGGDGAALLLTGNAMHADVPPDAAGSGVFGWLLTMLGQDVGFPVPEGGAQRFAEALAGRARARGVVIRTGSRVARGEKEPGRASGGTHEDGSRVRASRAVLADVDAPSLYLDLVGLDRLPARMTRNLERFQWDHATIKLNWALSQPVAWTAAGAHGAGTVHLGVDLDGFVDFAGDLSCGRIPQRPFLLFGQMTTSDASRSPEGTESAWAYSHVPIGTVDDPARLEEHVSRMTEAIERVAPGFSATILARSVQSPADLERADSNLGGGAINAGTSAVHQPLVFRPVPGLGRPETPVPGLYLAGASAHPGGGVHGACGWNAARAALATERPRGAVRRRLLRTAWGRLLRD